MSTIKEIHSVYWEYNGTGYSTKEAAEKAKQINETTIELYVSYHYKIKGLSTLSLDKPDKGDWELVAISHDEVYKLLDIIQQTQNHPTNTGE